jgi:hypothetical protein
MGSSTLESFLRMAEPAKLWAEIVPTTNCSLLECVNNEQGQIMLQTINHILKKINQEHVLYRTLEVLGAYLSH